jgi:hypothetical protein
MINQAEAEKLGVEKKRNCQGLILVCCAIVVKSTVPGFINGSGITVIHQQEERYQWGK